MRCSRVSSRCEIIAFLAYGISGRSAEQDKKSERA